MSTLIFELAGPLQAWGVMEGGETRPTSAYPSKSGVLGMVAAALGRNRFDDLSDLYSLRFGVRVDQPGTVVTDFQASRELMLTRYGLREQINGYPEFPKFADAKLSRRGYISDGVFTVALSGDTDVINEIARALVTPRYALYMGRRGCPAEPIRPVIRDENSPLDALSAVEVSSRAGRRNIGSLAVHVDAEPNDTGGDFHTTYDAHGRRNGWERKFSPRRIRDVSVAVPSNADKPITFVVGF